MNSMNDNFNPTKQDLFLLNWLLLIFILVVAMIIIGGITRITDSGLSMVEWRPFLGFLPPLNNHEWERVFDLYKNTLNMLTITKECYFQILNLFFSGNIFIDYGEE